MLQDQANAIAYRSRVLHEISQQASNQVSNDIHDRFVNQQKAKSDTQAQFMHYINGTASFSNPNDGSTLTLPSNYKYQYISNNDEVILSNDPTFSPPVGPSTSWQQMGKAN